MWKIKEFERTSTKVERDVNEFVKSNDIKNYEIVGLSIVFCVYILITTSIILKLVRDNREKYNTINDLISKEHELLIDVKKLKYFNEHWQEERQKENF